MVKYLELHTTKGHLDNLMEKEYLIMLRKLSFPQSIFTFKLQSELRNLAIDKTLYEP